jgi:hypothetical protein
VPLGTATRFVLIGSDDEAIEQRCLVLDSSGRHSTCGAEPESGSYPTLYGMAGTDMTTNGVYDQAMRYDR